MLEAKPTSKIRHLLRSKLRSEEAASTVMVLLLFVAFIGMAGFAIDMAKLRYVQQQTDNALSTATTTMASQLLYTDEATDELLEMGLDVYTKNITDVPYLDSDTTLRAPDGSKTVTYNGETVVVTKFYMSDITRQGTVTINQPSVTLAVYTCSPNVFLSFISVDEFCFNSESTSRLTQTEH